MAAFEKIRSVSLIAISEVLALSLWFSASVLVPSLATQFALSPFRMALFTSAVQLGFVIGALLSALFSLSDRIEPRRLFFASAVLAALFNTGIVTAGPAGPIAIALRLATGICMAGIYPVGMRLIATWAEKDLGLLVGLLVGALTLGSASPQLFNIFGGVDWKFTLIGTTLAALLASLLVLLSSKGPHYTPSKRVARRDILLAWKLPKLRLVNIGYFGHMWELYAMWAWIPLYLQESFQPYFSPDKALLFSRMGSFCVIAIGAGGSIVAGYLADRIGRLRVIIWSMATSGSCAILAGLEFQHSPYFVIVICLVWGISVIADSAQFSASVAEFSTPANIGTMLTVQTCIGFALTLVSIHLVPLIVFQRGWLPAFLALSVGPAVGILSIHRLRRLLVEQKPG